MRDTIVEEVRATRERLAAELGYDSSAIFQKLRTDQQKHGERLVRRQAVRRSSTSPGREPVAAGR